MTPNQSAEKLAVPDQKKLGSIQELCLLDAPYSWNKKVDALFVKAMIENVAWHKEHSPYFKNLLEQSGFDPHSLKTADDCADVPFILANFFKAHEVLSISKDKVFAHFTSSGTTGQKSQIFFDSWSMKSGQGMVDRIFDFYDWHTPAQKTNYLLYSYEVKSDSKLGTAYTDNFLCKYAPANSVFTALRLTGSGSHEFDAFGCIEKFKQFEKEGLPVRIFGFPAFLFFTLERMRDLGIPNVKLSKDSFVFLGGGWKANAGKAISKQELYGQVTKQLGIPDSRIRDGFGSVEHPIPYVECENHQFHIPVWSRVFIRDIKTLDVLKPGKKGFLHLVSPYITSMPAMSVLMGDLASVYEADSCGCGTPSPYFVVHGRAGTSRNRSCAVAAAELLKK